MIHLTQKLYNIEQKDEAIKYVQSNPMRFFIVEEYPGNRYILTKDIEKIKYPIRTIELLGHELFEII